MAGKRIVLITDAWHPQINGVVTAADMVHKGLVEKGHEVTIIHPGLFITAPLPSYRTIRMALYPHYKVRRMIRKCNPDAIHIFTEGSLGLAARSICVNSDMAFTTSFHTNLAEYTRLRLRPLGRPAKEYLRRFHNVSAHTMASTESLADTVRDHGIERVKIWPLGVDVNLFKKYEQEKKNSNPVFGYAGRIAIEKNVEEFLKTKFDGTKLIVGDGPDRDHLESKYADENTIFVGYKKGEELARLVSSMDVLVFPSLTDTFGLIIIEAMACGVPVAAHDVIGPRDIITHGVDGHLSDDLGEAAIKCLDIDSTKCRDTAMKYSWDNSVDTFLSLLVPIN